jgi:hypothetical protein
MARVLSKHYDIIIVVNTIDCVSASVRLLEMAKALRPTAQVLTYGHVSSIIPGFFHRMDVDAVVTNGDWELAIDGYVDYIMQHSLEPPPGLHLRQGDHWASTGAGRRCDSIGWGFAPLEVLPLADYQRVVGERELAVTVSRGCPVGCDWCKVPHIDGTVDRRRPVGALLDYLEAESFRFDFVSLFSPTFAARPEWVESFCSEKLRRGLSFRWKCTTTVFHSMPDLIPLMASAGCYRIGFGVETLEPLPQKHLGKVIEPDRVRRVIAVCRNLGVEPLCFLMVGVPGQTRAGLYYSIDSIIRWGGLPRVTAYAPITSLVPQMTAQQIEKANQKDHWEVDVTGMTKDEIQRLLFDHADRYLSTGRSEVPQAY